jgi:hypothetical protein
MEGRPAQNKFIINDNCYSFNLAWILSQLNLNIDESSSQLVNFNYGVFLISLVGLFCFINIIGYILAYFLLKKIDYEKNYPRLSKILDRYKKFSYFYFFLDVIICFICLSALVIFTLFFLLKNST